MTSVISGITSTRLKCDGRTELPDGLQKVIQHGEVLAKSSCSHFVTLNLYRDGIKVPAKTVELQ